MIKRFEPGLLTVARLNELVDRLNALCNFTIAPSGNAPARIIFSDSNTLLDFENGAGASLPILVCTEDGPALVEVLVKSAPVPVDDE